MNDARLAWLVAALFVAACQSAPAPVGSLAARAAAGGASTGAYYRSTGSRQCERGGMSAADLQRELAGVGVQVPQVTCGHDGRVYAQSCGGPDGRTVARARPDHLHCATPRS